MKSVERKVRFLIPDPGSHGKLGTIFTPTKYNILDELLWIEIRSYIYGPINQIIHPLLNNL